MRTDATATGRMPRVQLSADDISRCVVVSGLRRAMTPPNRRREKYIRSHELPQRMRTVRDPRVRLENHHPLAGSI